MKKKPEEERPEDLSAMSDEEVEARVHKMLDPNIPDEEEHESEARVVSFASEAKSKKIAVTQHEQDEADVPSAPVPPVTSNIVSAKTRESKTETVLPPEEVVDDVPSAPLVATVPKKAKPQSAEVKKESLSELAKTIEEANATLASKVAPVTDAPTDARDEETAAELGKVAADKVVDMPTQGEKSSETQPTVGDTNEELPETYNDAATEKAVDEITAAESDELLAAEDEKKEAELRSNKKQSSGLGATLREMLRSRTFRWALFVLVLGSVGTAAAVPATRYYALNIAGVRSSASLQIIDQSSQQPLKDVKVQLGDQSATTDGEGIVRFSKLKLGTTSLSVQKRAFTTISETVVLGWGSNPLGKRDISPAGSQYAFTVTDFLSGKPIAKAAATSEDADAQSDEKGQIKLTLEHSDKPSVEVTISANGYREEKVTLDLAAKQNIELKMVPARKVVFVSKRSGTFDLYKVDVDGKNEVLVLKGTASERDDLALIPHPTEELVALVSTRDGKRNKDGYLLSTLSLVNLNDNSTKSVTQSEQIQVANWLGNRLVYIQIAAGSSASDPNRQRLMSYDYKTTDNRQLATSNYFNDILTANGKIYYAPSSTFQPNGVTASLFRMNADGGGKQTVLPVEAWNVFRTSYDKLIVSVPNSWYEFKLDGTTPTKLDGQPSSLASRVYVDSPDGKHSIWVDNRDGKGVILLYDITNHSEKALRTQSGLKNPVRWLNDKTVIFRIHTDQETADYAMSLDGGEPTKVRDVTDTGGIDKWYYYN